MTKVFDVIAVRTLTGAGDMYSDPFYVEAATGDPEHQEARIKSLLRAFPGSNVRSDVIVIFESAQDVLDARKAEAARRAYYKLTTEERMALNLKDPEQ